MTFWSHGDNLTVILKLPLFVHIIMGYFSTACFKLISFFFADFELLITIIGSHQIRLGSLGHFLKLVWARVKAGSMFKWTIDNYIIKKIHG